MSTAITRKLDYTHYNFLSSITLLSSTLATLSTLQTSTQDLCSTFAASTAFLSQDIVHQISTHTTDFEARALRLESFEERMRKSKHDMAALVERLDAVKEKIEACENRDGASGRRRKGLTYGIGVGLSVLLTLFSINFLLHGGFSPSKHLSKRGSVDVKEAFRLQGGSAHVYGSRSRTAVASRREESLKLEDLEDDPRLGIFDEL